MSSYKEGQVHQLVEALEKNGFTSEHITKLGQFKKLSSIIKVLDGYAEINLIQHVVDCDVAPLPLDDWEVEEHRKGGQFKFDILSLEKTKFYVSPNQTDGKYIEGNLLRKELANVPVMNSNVLDYLLDNYEFIPKEWRNKDLYFWGTIYRSPAGRLFVRHLFNNDACIWITSFRRLNEEWQTDFAVAPLLK